MKRFVAFFFFGLFIHQNLYAAATSTEDDNFDTNQLIRILKELVGPDVKVTSDKDCIFLSGPHEALGNGTKKLRSFDYLRTQLLPPDCASRSVTNAADKPIESLNDLIKALGISSTHYDLLNISAPSIKRDEGFETFQTDTPFREGVVKLFIEDLERQSSFFAWARRNVPGIIAKDERSTTIHYGFLNDFLFLKEESLAPSSESSGEFFCVISRQNAIKTMIAAVNGNIALAPFGDGKTYKVQTISLGDAKNHGTATLEIIIDRSSSMDRDIYQINRALPAFLGDIKQQLPPDTSINVVIRSFNTELEEVGKYTISQKSELLCVPEISADGRTDLTLIGQCLKAEEGERKKIVAFTDGEHVSCSDINVFLKELRTFVKSSKGDFALPSLYKVGERSSTFFEDISTILGGNYSTQPTIAAFCASVAANIPELLRERRPLIFNLSGNSVHIEWVRNDESGIFTTKQTVSDGETVRLGDTLLTINQSRSEAEALQKQISELQDKLAMLLSKQGDTAH